MDNRAKSTGKEDKTVPPTFVSTMEANAPTNFIGVSFKDLLFVEIFAGTAKLSKQAREAGFRVLPIDKTSARSSQIYIAQYDLTEPDQFSSLMQVLHSEQHRIAAVHLAPACGTASKAREKKLSKGVKRGFKAPKPLRSADKPMGVDSLEGLDKIRTEMVNQVYEATATIIQFCIQASLLCSLETPENSLFWLYPAIHQI